VGSVQRCGSQRSSHLPDRVCGRRRGLRRRALGVDDGRRSFFVAAHHRADRFLYRGQPIEADVSYAFGYSGTTQIQLVVQHDDLPSIYHEMFPSGGGLHHVASLVADHDDARQRLLDQGHALACELDANDIHACYFDCRASLGCYVELHSLTDRIAVTFARWQRAHEQWDGQGAALRHHTRGT
jgi:hypothetical protein